MEFEVGLTLILNGGDGMYHVKLRGHYQVFFFFFFLKEGHYQVKQRLFQ